MTQPQHIIIGGRSKAGKSEAANALTGYTIIKFADALKDVVCAVVGITRPELEATKDNPRPIFIGGQQLAIINHHLGFRAPAELLFNRTFDSIRHLLKFLGTEVIREKDPDWHVRKLQSRIEPGVAYCAEDCRFRNERDAFPNPLSIYVLRPDLPYDDHESENSLGPSDFQHLVINDGSLAELHDKIKAIVWP